MTKHDPSNLSPAAVKANFILETVLQLVPLKRIAEVDDVANLASFLVSRDSDCTWIYDCNHSVSIDIALQADYIILLQT